MMASSGPPDPVFVLRGSQHPISSLLFLNQEPNPSINSSNYKLLSGTQNGRIDLWDPRTWRSVFNADLHSGSSLLSLYEMPGRDGVILSQGRDGSVQCTDLNTHKVTVKALKSPALGFCNICYTRLNNQEVAIIPSDNKSQLDICSLENGHRIGSLIPNKGANSYGMCMAVSKLKQTDDISCIIAAYEDGSITIWDPRNLKEIDNQKLHSESLMAMDYHPEINKGVSGSVDEMLIQWKLTDTQTIEKVRDFNITNPGIACVQFKKDGKYFVTGGWDGKVRAFGAKKCQPLAVLDCHKETVQCVDFSTDGLLAAGGKDRHISIWSIYR